MPKHKPGGILSFLYHLTYDDETINSFKDKDNRQTVIDEFIDSEDEQKEIIAVCMNEKEQKDELIELVKNSLRESIMKKYSEVPIASWWFAS